jgi:hypothetical protein
MVTIELYGVPRLRAGRATCEVSANRLGDALAELLRCCPALADEVVAHGSLLPTYRLSLNGQSFVTDPATLMQPGDCLLVIAADAGG